MTADVSAGHVPLVAGIAALVVLPPAIGYALTARGVGWVARRLRPDAVAVPLPTEPG